MTSDWQSIFRTVAARRDLTRDQARQAFACIMSGQLADASIAALLTALMIKGETLDELVGAALAMREAAVHISCVRPCIDTCGTGGDGISTFNVSTTAAIIAASAGAVVAKHGNRSTTRASGSSEVLTELGIDIDAQPQLVQQCLQSVGIAYLNARLLHPAMRFAAPARQAIPTRTICNLLGPLTNPAGARRQVLGVPSTALLDRMADALSELGAQHAWVVHGNDGLCDLTITGETTVVEVHDGKRRRFNVTPDMVGLARAPLDALRVRDSRESAKVITGILQNAAGPQRDHALLNSGAALVVAGIAVDLAEGVHLAARALSDGAAMAALDRWRQFVPGSRVDT